MVASPATVEADEGSDHLASMGDHIGFDVKDLQAFIKKLEANGIKLDRPYTKNEQTGAALAFITDPWGTYIELNERPNPAYIN